MHKNKSLLSARRHLRANMTPWEAKLWYYLRANRFNSLKFKRQTQIGNCIVDFSCWSKRVIIELDGSHHQAQSSADFIRQRFLESQGFTVLRFWNNEVEWNMDGVLNVIYNYCK